MTRRKPTEIRLLEGNPGHRPINVDRPRPHPIAPACPRWLAPAARKEWRRVAPALEGLGLLTEVDLAALASYCQAWARVEQCGRVLLREGLTYKTNGESGLVKARPEVVMEQRYIAIAARLSAEFGMTPSARGQMSLPARDEAKDDVFLSGPDAWKAYQGSIRDGG